MELKNKYEILLLLNPNLNEEELKETIKQIEDKLKGKIIKKEDWGLKNLSYEIEKNKKAFYVLYYIETEFENISNLKQLISVEKNILRPMILRHEKSWPFEMKTTKDIVFPESRRKNTNFDSSKSNRPQSKPSEETKVSDDK